MSCRAGILLCLLLATSASHADTWARPQVKEVFSASREYFVRVVPGESIGDTYGFAGAKKGRYAGAQFYRRAPDRSYQLVAEASLLNPVAPLEFFVADSGHLATLDNWHNVGYGKVVAIYDARGTPIRAYELGELFDANERQRFSRSVSSVHWRKGPSYVRQDQATLLVGVREGADFLFGMESGGFEYCEPHDKSFRCRDDRAPQRWTHSARRLSR
jgi:hypothetical protein